jgi:LuxR family transcriptional regulator, regulator of acetate metabolism
MTAIRARPAAQPLNFAGILARLSELGAPSEIRNQSPSLAAGTLGFDRVLLTSIRDGMLFADALHLSVGRSMPVLTVLQAAPIRLEYPSVESEIMRRRRAQTVSVSTAELGNRHAFAAQLGWTDYAAAPVIIDGYVIGFFHGDRQSSGRLVEESDADGLASFAACFAIAYERAVLRHRLRMQGQDLSQIASWAGARASELGDRAITLDENGDTAGDGVSTVGASGTGENALRDLLTRREIEVLSLMVRGHTNLKIARDLVVSEGTVKFHVKNILRKLHASNRAEATSRYLRLTLGRSRPSGQH